MDKKALTGHIMALITIVIWGTTFISTKILLSDFTPIEILFFRFILGLIVLIAIYPKHLIIKKKSRRLHLPWQDYVAYAYIICSKT